MESPTPLIRNESTQKKIKYCENIKPYSIKIVDHILDNIYGQIGITEVEKKIEKLPIFKRLHNISQLGAVNWIFPCAVHTRYVHSLGVMQMAHDMATHINMNASSPEGSASFFCDGEIQIIRLAGMLHDIGHYPLSHNIEAAYKDGNKEIRNNRELIVDHQKELVGCPSYLASACSGKRPFLHDDNSEESWEIKCSDYLDDYVGSKGYHHEAVGAKIVENNLSIKKEIKDYFVLIKVDGNVYLNPICAPVSAKEGKEFSEEEIDKITSRLLKMIASIIKGNYEYCSKEYRFEEKYSAMVQLIHSELDADNLDYLLHDATFSGTSYGIMDVGVLLNCLTVKKITLIDPVSGNANDIRYLVGILPKGIGCVEQFYSNKYLAYSQMIYSKYVSALETMILNWAKHSLPHHKVYGLEDEEEPEKAESEDREWEVGHELFLRIVGSKKTETSYLHFTDAFVLQEIYRNYTELLEGSKKRLGNLDVVRRAILSRLSNYTSFEVDQECLCVGFGEKDIRKQLLKDSTYKEYANLIRKIGQENIGTLRASACDTDDNKNYEKKLIAFRFESYSMTKQLPMKEFRSRISPPNSENIVKRHYFRLANGIPIFNKDEKTDYFIKIGTEAGIDGYDIDVSKIPMLIVDTKASSLHTTWNQKFVYLRKYKIEEI